MHIIRISQHITSPISIHSWIFSSLKKNYLLSGAIKLFIIYIKTNIIAIIKSIKHFKIVKCFLKGIKKHVMKKNKKWVINRQINVAF